MGWYGAARTVGFGKIAIINGIKRGGTVLGIPWVLAKSQLPTVGKGAARRCAYRGFWQKRDYQRYKKGRHSAWHTVGFGKIAITNGRKRGGTALRVPWVLAKTRLPTVEKGTARYLSEWSSSAPAVHPAPAVPLHPSFLLRPPFTLAIQLASITVAT